MGSKKAFGFGFSDFSYDAVCRRTRLNHLVFSNQIAIISESGCGSSTTVELLQKGLGMPHRFVSSGSIMRVKAAELGMSIEALSKFNREHPEEGLDYKCDSMIYDFAQQNYTVFDGRLVHLFAPRAYVVRLTASLEVRAIRRQKQSHPDLSVDQVAQLLAERDSNDSARYDIMYPGWRWTLGHGVHDEIDTGDPNNIPYVVVDRIFAGWTSWKSRHEHRIVCDVNCV